MIRLRRAAVQFAETAGWLTMVRAEIVRAYLGERVAHAQRTPKTESDDDEIDELVNRPELVWARLKQEVAMGEPVLRIPAYSYFDKDESYDIAKMGVSLKTQSQDPRLDRDYAIFWLHYRRGLSPAKISGLRFGLSPMAVEDILLHLIRTWRAHLLVRTFVQHENGRPNN